MGGGTSLTLLVGVLPKIAQQAVQVDCKHACPLLRVAGLLLNSLAVRTCLRLQDEARVKRRLVHHANVNASKAGTAMSPVQSSFSMLLQAYKLISGAQRRSELQQKTAAVEAKIVVADREMQGLHAALVRLNGSNQGLIQSFKCACQPCPRLAEMHVLHNDSALGCQPP